MIKAKCFYCGIEFVATRQTAKYCSSKCRQAQYRQDKANDEGMKPVSVTRKPRPGRSETKTSKTDSVTPTSRPGRVEHQNGQKTWFVDADDLALSPTARALADEGRLYISVTPSERSGA